jgi:hypothetical protein
MPKRPLDFSFERDGSPLSAWLRDLVADDAPTRLAAGEALQAMSCAMPSVHTEVSEIDWGSARDLAGHADRFKEAIRAAVRARGFPAADFVRRLIAYRMAVQDDWLRRVEQASRHREASGPLEERLIRRVQAAGDEAERAEATDRYLKWVFAHEVRDCKRSKAIYAGAEAMTAANIAARVVFDALDEILLVDRPGLRAMLGHKELFHDAAKALARIGPPAVEFAGFFLDRLDTQETAYRFHGAEVLGSIGRDDPAVIDGLLRRLRSGTDAARVGAAEALGRAGPPLAGRLEIALDFLLGATHDPLLVFAATEALASVGRDREEALGRVLELAAPRPPRWRPDETFPEYRHDEVMFERGAAIDALRHFRRFADRVVPVLVDAFDTFEEYDHDWGYHGEHGRICWTLGHFGPDAAPAVPRLIRYLGDWRARTDESLEWPKDAFGLLAAIGLPAAAALPILERFRPEPAHEGEASPDDPEPHDPLGRAILALRGES